MVAVYGIVDSNLQVPTYVSYYDHDMAVNAQAGYVYWSNPADITGITGYQLSYVMSNGSAKAFAQVNMKTAGSYQIFLASAHMPTGVESIMIRPTNNEGHVGPIAKVDVEDQATGIYYVSNVQYYDIDMTAGEIAGRMSWNLSTFSNILQQYVIYFADSNNNRISKIGAVAANMNEFVIPANTVVPNNATRLIVFSKSNVLMSQYWWYPLTDRTPPANLTTTYRNRMRSMMDVTQNGYEIDDIVKYIAVSYDMNGDNIFNVDDVNLMLYRKRLPFNILKTKKSLSHRYFPFSESAIVSRLRYISVQSIR